MTQIDELREKMVRGDFHQEFICMINGVEHYWSDDLLSGEAVELWTVDMVDDTRGARVKIHGRRKVVTESPR